MGHPEHAYSLSSLNLVLYLEYAQNNRIYLHGYDLIKTLKGQACINQSTNSETTIHDVP